MKHKFRVRPGYRSKKLLIEFCGDHHSNEFPDVYRILSNGLNSKSIRHPELDTLSIALTSDEIISIWQYSNGRYEIDDDIWSLFIIAPSNNLQIIMDIESVLVASGMFEKEEVDYSEYNT
jgi:hypothetical protein